MMLGGGGECTIPPLVVSPKAMDEWLNNVTLMIDISNNCVNSYTFL